jgi:hypothetical protein
MTVVSSKEFTTHQRKYFGMAMDSGVCIKRGRNMFRLMHEPTVDDRESSLTENEVWNGMYSYLSSVHPDGLPPMLSDEEEISRAITVEELLVGVKEDLRELFAKEKQAKQ